MEENFKEGDGYGDLIRRYESLRENDKSFYFSEKQYESIVHYYAQSGESREAIRAADIAIEQYPYSTEFLILKALACSNLEEYAAAISILEKASILQPYDSEIYLIKGNIQALNKDFSEAAESFEKALLYADKKDKIHHSIGLMYQYLRRYHEAIEQYKAALEENLNNEEVICNLACCLEKVGELEGSLEYYRELIDRDPHSEYAWYNLGIAYNELHRFEEAIDAFEYAIAIRDQFSSAYLNMGKSYMQLEKLEEALDAYRVILEREEPSPDVLYGIAEVYERIDQNDIAIQCLRQAIDLNEFYAKAWYLTGVCLSKKENWYEAVYFFNEALKLDSENPKHLKSLAEAKYRACDSPSSPDVYYDEAIRLSPENLEIWLDWSFIYYEQGDNERALELIHKGIAENPEAAELYYRAVVYLIEDGQQKQAFSLLEQALSLNFDLHVDLYEFFPNPETQKSLFKIIEQYKQ